jgi:hypothetical protein
MSKNIVNKNVIVNNVFSDEQIASIYNDINLESNKDIMMQDFYGRLYIPLYWRQKTHISDPIDLKINQSIFDSIINYSSKFSNVELQIESISFARYSSQYGIPLLHPHTDTNFKEPRLTFDVQLSGNVTWPIVIEHKEYILQNNDAVVFSGTHDIHWRSRKVLENDEYVDILLCQLSEKTDNPNTIDDEFMKNIDIKQKVLRLKYEKGML